MNLTYSFPIFLTRLVLKASLLCLLANQSIGAQTVTPSDQDDPYLWLEAIDSEQSMAWVKQQNKITLASFASNKAFKAMQDEFQEVLDNAQRIPQVTRRGSWFYNLWQDGKNPRGVWRRTSLESFKSKEPVWEVLLDLDELGRSEAKSWVWAGATCYGPDYKRCLIQLSPGGSDANIVREFDVETRSFLAQGFHIPEAKTSVDWIDIDTIYVASQHGPNSLTDAGYPRTIRRWKRGSPLQEAEVVFEAKQSDVAAWVQVDATPGYERTIFGRMPDFFSSEQFLLQGKTMLALQKPPDAQLRFWYEHVLLELRSPMLQKDKSWPAGSLLISSASSFLAGKPQWHALFTPSPSRSLENYSLTRSSILLNVLDQVSAEVEILSFKQGRWTKRQLKPSSYSQIVARGIHDSQQGQGDPLGESFLLSVSDFLNPDRLQLAQSHSETIETLKALPTFFDTSQMIVEQGFATSKDGTSIPYFLVRPRGNREQKTYPTLLHGYGGFQISELPRYSAVFGRGWLARGGALAIANIRGGGEFGPQWHQAAMKANKQKSYDDFAAVANDLITRGVTSPSQLAIRGGSNGGLLVGSVMLQKPDYFAAVVCQVPLLDMKRYHLLLAGASWMAEYGNPEIADEWAWISAYSPYQNVKPQQKLPPLLLMTSTRDDRVHPGHARKMAARMLEQGHRVSYYENIEGGHGGAADSSQRAFMLALEFSFLWQTLSPR